MALVVVLGLLLFAGLGCGSDETATDETTEDTAASADTSVGESSDTSEAGDEVAAPTGEPIVFGAVVSATGPAAALGEQERDALEMLEGQLNDRGGLLGRPVEIVIEDDQSNPNEAVTATNKLIQQDGVVAIIGGTISPSTLAMKPITAREGIPQVTMSAANAITDEPPIEWIWRTPPKDALAVARALTYVSEELGVTRIAVLHDENAFGSSGLNEIEKSAADYGLEVVAKESYKTDETDLTAPLTKIRSSEPEALVVWGTNPGPAVAAKNMDQLGMDIPYVGSHGIANMTFIDLAGEAAEGVVFPAGKMLIPETITDPAQKEVVDGFIAA
ncbi:MAG TPA: ABC transporter substrate-binding protein, partial [Thermoleophilia bacterium]|nr:ABC transporter substrate-binding protein [Thermoleophilia bacterium]